MNVEIQGSSSHISDMNDQLNRTQARYSDLVVQKNERSNVIESLTDRTGTSRTDHTVALQCAGRPHADVGERPHAYRTKHTFADFDSSKREIVCDVVATSNFASLATHSFRNSEWTPPIWTAFHLQTPRRSFSNGRRKVAEQNRGRHVILQHCPNTIQDRIVTLPNFLVSELITVNYST